MKLCYTCKSEPRAAGGCSYCKSCRKTRLTQKQKEAANKRAKNWYLKNKDQKRAYDKNRTSTEEYKSSRNKTHRKRYRQDVIYKSKYRMRNLVRNALKRRAFKKLRPSEDILGISFEDLKMYLEYTYLCRYGIETDWNNVHIDHIIPISVAQTEEEVIRLNHYTNLQLLTAKDNLKKSNLLEVLDPLPSL